MQGIQDLARDVFQLYAQAIPHPAETDGDVRRLFDAVDTNNTEESIHVLAVLIEKLGAYPHIPIPGWIPERWGKLAREWHVAKERGGAR